jgi:glycosyltransferase involved in cell wall biosynthesis
VAGLTTITGRIPGNRNQALDFRQIEITMKIAVVGPVYPFRGGIAHFSSLLVLKLSEQHEIFPVTFTRQYPACLYPGGSDRDTGPGRLLVEAQALLDPLDPFSWERTAGAIIREKPDRVILQWWVPLWGPAMGYLVRRLRNAHIPVIYIIHNALPHEPGMFDSLLARCALKPANRFIVMNEREREKLAHLVSPNAVISQCPLPVFSVFPATGQVQRSARKELGLPVGKKLILFFGIVRPYKGLGNLIKAFGMMRISGRTDIELVVAGEFWEDKRDYLAMIDSLGLTGVVHIFDRFISDHETSLLFTAVDLYIGPYLDGTQSASVKTALSFGLPMVVTRVVADEIVRENPQVCLITESPEPEELEKHILKMLGRPRLSPSRIRNIGAKSWRDLIACLVRDDDRSGMEKA